MKTIKINCPKCDEIIELIINDDLTLGSIRINTIEISEKEQIETMKKIGIEFG